MSFQDVCSGEITMRYCGKPAEIVPRMQELISRNEGFWLAVTGNSMTPSLKHLQDRVYISPFNGKAKKGDILLTLIPGIPGNHCLLHRVFKCNGNMLYYKGDALTTGEGPFPSHDVIGIVTKIEQNGKVIPVNTFYKLRSMVGQKVWQFKRFAIRVFKKLKRLLSNNNAVL